MVTSRMEAGRELDALVAEKVMGWQRYRVSSGVIPGFSGQVRPVVYLASGTPPANMDPEATSDPVTYRNNLPRYSTDIAAAWEVVEKVCRDHPTWSFTLDRDTREWNAYWHENVGPGWSMEGYGEAETAPLAICLAALELAEESAPPHREEQPDE